MKGAKLIIGERILLITDTEGYTRADNDTGIYRPVIGETPGTIIGIQHRRGVLPLVITIGGGCVLIRSIEVNGEDGKPVKIKGPGKVANIIGLQKGDVRRLRIEDPYDKVLRLI